MRALSLSNADGSARPGVEVRAEGVLLKRIAPGAAEALVARGWAEWIGSGRRRYLALTASAPISSLHYAFRGNGTRPVRADQTCRVYAHGQVMGESKSHREHIPTRY